jgi:hypothetical protein
MTAFTIWNNVIIRRTGRRRSNLNDDRYYELKSKQEYIIALSAIVIAAFGIFGIKTIEDAKIEIRKQYQSEKDSLTFLKNESGTLTEELKNHSCPDKSGFKSR